MEFLIRANIKLIEYISIRGGVVDSTTPPPIKIKLILKIWLLLFCSQTKTTMNTINQLIQYHNLPIAIIGKLNDLWFKGKDIAKILDYSDTKQAISNNISEKNRRSFSSFERGGYGVLPPFDPQTIFINESGLYQLIMRSKKEEALMFQDWVTGEVLPSIRKTGSYALNLVHDQLSIMTEPDLHKAVVRYIQPFKDEYQLIITPTLGENSTIHALDMGYDKGSFDLIIDNPSKDGWHSFKIEFKTPRGDGLLSPEQQFMERKYKSHKMKTLVSTDYAQIICEIHDYLKTVLIPCDKCNDMYTKELMPKHIEWCHNRPLTIIQKIKLVLKKSG